MRLSALLALFIFTISFSAQAKGEKLASVIENYKGFKDIILDDPLAKPHVMPRRPVTSDLATITRKSALTNPSATDTNVTGCLEIEPYSHISMMDYVGQAARIMANNSAAHIEQLAVRPHFSGLKGPDLTIMRSDIERALVTAQGSANEIYHNAEIAPQKGMACDDQFKSTWDIELLHHIDAWDSNEAPLYRSDLIINTRYHFGGYFLGTVSARYLLHDNLEDEPDLRLLNRPDPIRQDVLGYSWQGFNLNRLMLSGFATPVKNLYIAGHAGYLEKMFFGLGGEFLYRPYDSALSIGGEIWGTTKRVPYLGNVMTMDDSNKQTSALLNLWYDVPMKPLSIGLSAGRFLDGDTGYQLRTRYKPAQGWRVEGYATYSNQKDATVNLDDDTNWIVGARLTMPLGQFKGLPDNSRQTFAFDPFARDHGQRLDNAYPLYDLTDAWQAREVYRYWDDVVSE